MKPLIVANWKANPSTLAEAKKLFTAVRGGLIKKPKADVVICPPFVFLSPLNAMVNKKSGGADKTLHQLVGVRIKLGAQDVFWQEGAFTGEVSAQMLKDIGCKYAIVGHSERRFLGETNEMINRKLRAAVSTQLSPIFCIGESEQERKEGKTKEVLERQLTVGLKDISKFKIQNSKLVIAYEPVWAISTTFHHENCDFEDALSMQILVRKIISELYNRQVSKK